MAPVERVGTRPGAMLQSDEEGRRPTAPVRPVTIVLPPLRSSRLRRLVFSVFEGVKAHVRVVLKAHQLTTVRLRPELTAAGIVLILVVRDEADRIPYFLQYYRALGIEHFIVIDNDSADDLGELLVTEQDVSVLRAHGSYRSARYGNDWVNRVLGRHCRDKWVLYVDVDEFLVFDGSEERTVPELIERLDGSGLRTFSARMIDMYSERTAPDNRYRRGTDPLEVCSLFDAGGYERQYEEVSLTTWIKGGPRGRIFFRNAQLGPALNKVPIVHWSAANVYLKSSHQLWPLRLNREAAQSSFSGALLHQKFLSSFALKVADPLHREEHTSEYGAYRGPALADTFVSPTTTRYRTSGDLVDRGLIRALPW